MGWAEAYLRFLTYADHKKTESCSSLPAVSVQATRSPHLTRSHQNGWTRVSAPNTGLGERHHRACPRKSTIHHRDQWPTFTRSPKCSSPLLNFSSSLSHPPVCAQTQIHNLHHHMPGRPALLPARGCKTGDITADRASEESPCTDQSHLWPEPINQAQMTA